REKVFKVTGIIECGVYSYDVSIGVTSLDNIQEFFNIGDIVHGIGIRTEDIYNSEQIAGKIRELLNYKYEVSTWIQKNKILFAALALEKKAMGIILLLIILVASFNIASTLMITVFRKTKEIGILKAMGVSSKEIKKIFIYEGLILGIEGLAFGLLIGGILAFSLKKYHFIKLPEMVYNLSTLPIQITFKDIIFMCIAVLFIVIISTFYPAYRAGKLNPAEALRYE
ncbi:MAG: lipoprotein-releasing system transmembrane subunit LolC, partial [Candidatus Omnitrophota bacterium]